MASKTCPKVQHFHVVFEQVGSYKRPNRALLASSPEEALALFLPTLPTTWRGGVSIFDDSIGHEDEMPLLHRYVQLA
jgi:hypothetical protein